MGSILNCGCYWFQAETASSHPCTCRTSMFFKTLRLGEFSGAWITTYLPYISKSLPMATACYREVIRHSAGSNVTSMERPRLLDAVLQMERHCWDEYCWLCRCLQDWWDARAAQQETTQESSVWFTVTYCFLNIFQSAKYRKRVILGDCFLYKSCGYNSEFGDPLWAQLQWQK